VGALRVFEVGWRRCFGARVEFTEGVRGGWSAKRKGCNEFATYHLNRSFPPSNLSPPPSNLPSLSPPPSSLPPSTRIGFDTFVLGSTHPHPTQHLYVQCNSLGARLDTPALGCGTC
jgi:hypothetical protein